MTKTFNFSKALELLKEGNFLSRLAWQDSSLSSTKIYLTNGSEFVPSRPPLSSIQENVIFKPHFDKLTSTRKGNALVYTAQVITLSNEDILADDWYVPSN